MVPEGADEARAFTTDTPQGMGSPAGELPEIAGAQIGQLVLFPVPPEVLYRVKFRGIGGDTFHPDFALQAFQVRTHELAAVGGYAIPDDEQLPSDVTLEMFQEIDHLLCPDCTGIEPKIKVPPR